MISAVLTVLYAGIIGEVLDTAMWPSVTGWKMTDVSREHGALILKGVNALDQFTVFWCASPFNLLYIYIYIPPSFGKTYSLPFRT